MTLRLATILTLLAGAAFCESEHVVRDEKLNFEIRTPAAAADWENIPTRQLKAHFCKWFETDDVRSEVRVQLFVWETARTRPLDKVAERWRANFEESIKEVEARKTSKGTLGGQEAVVSDVRGKRESAPCRITWMVTQRGSRLYVFHVQRTKDVVDNKQVDEEVEQIRASFRFLREEEGKPPAADEVPEELRARTITHDFGRFECLKPEGLRRILEIDTTEAATGVVLKFDNVVEGSRCLIRVYARKGGKESIRQLAEDRIERFEKAYPPNKRRPVEKDAKWKLPLARKTLVLRMKALGKSTILHRWYFAECRNQRQYQLEIFISGGGDWSKQVDAFLESFEPFKKKKSRG